MGIEGGGWVSGEGRRRAGKRGVREGGGRVSREGGRLEGK